MSAQQQQQHQQQQLHHDSVPPQGPDHAMHDSDDLKQQSSPNSHLQGGSVRRRASRAGTRSVSTLSAQQLERKRANDREAQRAIRQRTKENTERLESRVRDLEAQLEAAGAGPSTQVPALMQRIREQENEIGVLRIRLDQAVAAMGIETVAMSDHNARAPDANGDGNSMPLMGQPQINQAQMASSMMTHGTELSRPGSNYGYRPSSQWQQASGYGAHSGTGIKRDSTPSAADDHSPETMSGGWSSDRQRTSDHHQQQQQQQNTQPEYTHMLNGQAPSMSMRTGGQQQPMPYQATHESHGYQLPPHGNPNMTSYSPAHGGHLQQPYMPHQASGSHAAPPQHPQQSPHPQHPGHPQQSPHLQQLPPPHGSLKQDRDGSQQQNFYTPFPQG